jgi:uncharacterized protein YjbJ (UPF0337 family)
MSKLHPTEWRFHMKLAWVVAGVGVGAAVAYLLLSERPMQFGTATDTAYGGVEDAAREAFDWGTKSRAKGKVRSMAGAIKEGVGRMAGDADLVDRGSAQRIAGDVQDAAGTLGHAVGKTLHDLNK